MLKSLQDAHSINGNNRGEMATLCGVSPSMFSKWMNGKAPIPTHRRAIVERAFSAATRQNQLALPATVDWQGYDAEFNAQAPKMKPSDALCEISAPQAAQVTPKPASGPENAPAPRKGGFWAGLIVDDTESAHAL